LTKPKQDVMM